MAALGDCNSATENTFNRLPYYIIYDTQLKKKDVIISTTKALK